MFNTRIGRHARVALAADLDRVWGLIMGAMVHDAGRHRRDMELYHREVGWPLSVAAFRPGSHQSGQSRRRPAVTGLHERFVDHLLSKGWMRQPRSDSLLHTESLVADAASIAAVPPSYIEFLSGFQSLSSEDEATWFLTLEDYAGATAGAFSWDEFERMSLDAAMDGRDAESVRVFWREYLPVVLSVGGDYEFIAVSRLSGLVVHGVEPEFESVTRLAENVDALMHKVIEGQHAGFFFD